MPMRTMLVGLFPAKSISDAVAQVGLINPIFGAVVKELWTKPNVPIVSHELDAVV